MKNGDLKYSGSCGSFEGLYTFLEAAKIYGLGDSCFRKQVSRKKLVRGLMLRRWVLLGLLRSKLWLGILGWRGYWSIKIYYKIKILC